LSLYTTSADCCRRMKIPLRICSFTFSFPLSLCHCSLLLSVDRNSAYDARLCCIRGGRTLGAPRERAFSACSPTRLLFTGSSRQQQQQHYRTHTDTTRPAHEKAKDVARTCPFPFSFLRVRVFLERKTRRADEARGVVVGGVETPVPVCVRRS
jgi:hypothetical protein